jgi:hypothetical protein
MSCTTVTRRDPPRSGPIPRGRTGAADNTATDRADVCRQRYRPAGSPRVSRFRRVGDGTLADADDAGTVNNRAERHHRGRPTPAGPVVIDQLDAFGADERWYLLVDYHCSPLGAWTATVAPTGWGR